MRSPVPRGLVDKAIMPDLILQVGHSFYLRGGGNLADHEKGKASDSLADQEFLQHEAWWEKEEPRAPLPQKIVTMLQREDEAVIDELLRFAFLVDGRLKVRDGRAWRVVPLPDELRTEMADEDGSWLWTLYLTEHRLARIAVRQLLRYQPNLYTLEHRLFKEYQWMQSDAEVKWRGGKRNALIPFNAKYFRYVKAIFKLAEKRRDAETWAILAHRFDLERKGNEVYHAPAGQEVEVYSDKTHYYLRRRCWRFLRELGKKGDPAFIRFAVEVLLQYEEQDGRHHFWRKGRGWVSYRDYRHLWLFNHLLYHHSKRFKPSKLQWRRVDGSAFETDEREEAFQSLWDQYPEELWRLFRKAKSEAVIQFAWKALHGQNLDFLQQISPAEWVRLLDDQSESRQQVALQWVMEHHLQSAKGEINLELLEQLLFHGHYYVRKEAGDWFGRQKDGLPHSFKVHVAQLLLDVLKTKALDDWMMVRDAYQLLAEHCQPYLRELAHLALAESFHQELNRWSYRPTGDLVALILDVLDVERLGITGDQLLPYLCSSADQVRRSAAHLLEQHFEKLRLDLDFLLKLIAIPDRRVQLFTTQFLSSRQLWVIPFYPGLLPRLWEMMLDEQESAVVRTYIRKELLGNLFFHELKETPVSRVWPLLQHREHEMQAFGARVLELIEPQPEDFSLPQLVSLTHQPLAAIRQAARQLLERLRVIWTPDLLANVMETEWDDTREWGKEIVSSLPDEERSPDWVYVLLDTAREDIRALAMDLIEQHFEQLDMAELMVRASESPYLEVQEFALTVADRLPWNAERLSELGLFFRTVFFRVHRGRRAKNLAFALLERLVLEQQESAEALVPLLSDLLPNIGRYDFERILHLLTQIQVRYPQLKTPLSFK